MAKELLPVLQAVGLDDKEAQLYLAGLQIGSAPASDYAKTTGLNRITTYNALESLVHRSLFTFVKKMRGKWYAPVAPEYLSLEVQKNAQALERALPELRSLQGTSFRKPRVRFFEGWEGIRKVYEDTLTAKSELLNFANSTVVRKFWPSYDDEYVAQRVKHGIYLRGIAPDDATGKRVHGEDKQYLREIRLVSSKDFDFRNEIKIYDHKVAIVSFGTDQVELFGVIIESKEVAETQRQIFEMAWRYAGRRS
ncbi:MAG TPA: helix-turn-helix domain-containing protein [Candidatus Peribacteraceae bacterium]|nr:helix-turn-helix domain-containing protein [Candidatus Peribacteraceae bacterium]